MATTVQTSTSGVSQELLDKMNTRTSTSASDTEDIQNRFMTLLIAQMENQDPLNPMDNAQVTSQMAQLSTVTGINQMNDTMESLLSSNQANQTYQASSMIGHNVLVKGNAMTVTEDGGYLGIELDTSASAATVSIKDSDGNVVKEIELGSQTAGTTIVKWDGLLDDGTSAEAGDYTFSATYTVSGTSKTATPLNVVSVSSVSSSTSGVTLNLSNQTSVTIDDIKEIY